MFSRAGRRRSRKAAHTERSMQAGFRRLSQPTARRWNATRTRRQLAPEARSVAGRPPLRRDRRAAALDQALLVRFL